MTAIWQTSLGVAAVSPCTTVNSPLRPCVNSSLRTNRNFQRTGGLRSIRATCRRGLIAGYGYLLARRRVPACDRLELHRITARFQTRLGIAAVSPCTTGNSPLRTCLISFRRTNRHFQRTGGVIGSRVVLVPLVWGNVFVWPIYGRKSIATLGRRHRPRITIRNLLVVGTIRVVSRHSTNTAAERQSYTPKRSWTGCYHPWDTWFYYIDLNSTDPIIGFGRLCNLIITVYQNA